MVKDFKISLSSTDERRHLGAWTFKAGETVSGTLDLTLSEPKSYRCISIGLYGLAEVKQSTVRTKAIVQKVTMLWNSSDSVHSKIGPGTYNLAFHFSLPPTCPSSVSGSRGSVRYFLQGCIVAEGSLQSHNHSIVLPIKVTRISNDITGNLIDSLVPVQHSKSKVVGLLKWKGSVEFTVSLTRSCFCIGQRLPVVVDVINGHPCSIRMRAYIKRYLVYCFARPPQCEKHVLTSITSCEINPHNTHTWVIEDLYVPIVEASLDSAIIRVEYKLKVSTIVPMARKVVVKIPITLYSCKDNVHVPFIH